MKRITIFICLLVAGISIVSAQKIKVSGTVIDGSLKEGLASASVVLLDKDSAMVAGVSADVEGRFTLPAVKAADYIFRITYMGFAPYYKNLTLTKSQKSVDLGTIVMEEDAKMMREAVVDAALAQVEVKADTFVYNADAYRLPEGSNLEELVRKLPGAEIDEDGTLKINGKTVSKILVKGKEFFNNDKDMALKNLPTKMVSKIKAYERKSDYARITGIDDGEEETVLDLTVKRGMGEGWLLKVDLAAGKAREDELPGVSDNIKFPVPIYTGNITLSRFTDNLQFMLIASRNNINNGSGRWGGFGGGSGVTTTTMAGLNVTWTNGLPQGTHGYLEVGGNVRYNGRDAENMSLSNSETFLPGGGSSFNNGRNWSNNVNHNFNADMRLEWMPDSLTTITFRPSFSHSQNDNEGRSESVTFDADPYEKMADPLAEYGDDDLFTLEEIRVNSNRNESHSNGISNSGNFNLQLNRRLGKPGRNVTADFGGNYSHSDNESFAWTRIHYYKTSAGETLKDRYTLSPSESWNVRSRLSYTEPLTSNLNLQFSYQYQRRFSDNDRTMYNLENLLGEAYTGGFVDEVLLHKLFTEGVDPENEFAGGIDWRTISIDALNSQYATYKENNHNAQVMFRYNNKFENGRTLRLNAGLSLQPQNTRMHYRKGEQLDTTVVRTTMNWAPRVDLRWKISDVSQLRINYNPRMNQPSMTQLMEVTDDSNPLNVNTGNAGLRSSWSNNLFAEYNGYRERRQTSWSVRGGYGNTRNGVASATIYDATTGARYTRPMNIDGNWNTWGNVNFNTAMGEKKFWNFSNNLFMNYNYRLGYLSTNVSEMVYDLIDPLDPSAGKRVNLKETFDNIQAAGGLLEAATKTMGLGENVRINYRKTFGDDWSVDFSANAGFFYNHTRSSSQQGNNIDSWRYNYGGNATVMFPWGITFTTNITEQCRRGYTDKSMNTNELLWNATLQKSFLKEKAATISIEWNDILHQRSNVSRAISEFSRTDTYSNNINSYFLVRFIYQLNLMGDKEARSMMPAGGFGGPGGPGGGGRGPGGGGGRGPGGGGGRF